MLVLDFEVNGVNFAFDILEKNNILRTFLIIRNDTDTENYKKLNYFNFEKNKADLGELSGYEELLMIIFLVHQYYLNES